MGCATCGTSKGGVPTGCGSKGHCSSGGCNKMNTYDWLSDLDIYDPNAYNYVEVSFKQGARKEIVLNEERNPFITGDTVVIQTSSGHDVGLITLSGELVRLQMKKKRLSEDRVSAKTVRLANQRDLEKLEEARGLEYKTLLKARRIIADLDLNMKLGDVEYQGDKRKATFYYTAEGRVDFRELVRMLAREFRIKVEMRQIGSRQESARIGGLGSCGRELCCSTWLSDFKSVSTTAARYQNIAINQTKLSGQCGRLKCCLNYELNTYLEAIKSFPKHVDRLKTKKGTASLIKMDIFKGIMYYHYNDDKLKGPMIPLPKERVAEIKELNKKREYPDDLIAFVFDDDSKPMIEYEDVTGAVELPAEKKKRRNNKRKKRKKPQNKANANNSGKPNTRNKNKSDSKKSDSKEDGNKPKKENQGRKKPRNPNQRRKKPRRNTNQNKPDAKDSDKKE